VKLCYVTDRKALAGTADEQIRGLLEKIESCGRAGVDCIQVREKDLSGHALSELTGEALRRAPGSCRIVVNDRVDVALATGAAGVHLGEQSLPVSEARRFLREQKMEGKFLVGASAHSLESALAAEEAGADYVIYGPVFATPSKARYGAPQGLEKLKAVCQRSRIPVIAIGGVMPANARECVEAGAAGVAAIRLFQDTTDLPGVVRELRAAMGR